ncbi:MAG: cupin domain-containing protein [Candidatus Paceibacterota bacterium]|jgi:mannose-6-phosphate isomerase-like protein (cupin superfamily)
MKSNTLRLSRRWYLCLGGIAALALASAFIIRNSSPIDDNPVRRMSYQGNIVRAARDNADFRRVLFTGQKSQLVVMSIPPGGEVGSETHRYTEQTLFFLSGTGEGILDGKTFSINPGDVVVVVPGTEHNFINTGAQDMKIYTVYAPPNHIDGRVHATKADADADVADEAVGERP